MELTLDQALQKGINAHQSGQIQEAERLYTAILKTYPKHPDANHNMGVLAVGVGETQKALPYFKTALETNSSIGQFWLSYIDVLIKLDRMVDVQSVLAEAKEKGVKGEISDQLEQRLNSPNEVSIDPPQAQLKTLINLYTQGKLQNALSETTQMLERFPNSIALYNIAGASNAGLMQFNAAIDCYKQALKIKPDCAVTYNNIGNALKDKGDSEAAIESYKQALKIKPDCFDSYYNMGVALQDKGDSELAIGSYKQALKIKPDYAEAYNNMGSALQDKGDSEAAIESYKQALKIKPDFAEAFCNIGSILVDMGEIEAAVVSFYNGILLKPDFKTEMKLSEVLLRYKKDASRALPLLESALNKFQEAEQLVSFSNLVRTENIQRYTSLDIVAFNKQLLCELLEHPRRVLETNTHGWAIRGGTAIRNLFVNPESLIKTFEEFLR